jgi:hypothetical protein
MDRRIGQTFDEELREGNEAEYIRREHGIDVLVLDIAYAISAMGATGVIDWPRRRVVLHRGSGSRSPRRLTPRRGMVMLTEDVDVAELLRYL